MFAAEISYGQKLASPQSNPNNHYPHMTYTCTTLIHILYQCTCTIQFHCHCSFGSHVHLALHSTNSKLQHLGKFTYCNLSGRGRKSSWRDSQPKIVQAVLCIFTHQSVSGHLHHIGLQVLKGHKRMNIEQQYT